MGTFCRGHTFSSMEMFEFFCKLSLNIVHNGPIRIILEFVQIIANYQYVNLKKLQYLKFVVETSLTHCPLLTHWGWVTHICISKLTIIDSDNGLSPGQCQAIISTSDEILLIGPLGTNFSAILIKIHTFSFKKILFQNVVWEMAAILSRPQCVNAIWPHKSQKNDSR